MPTPLQPAVSDLIANWINPDIQAMIAYHVPAATGLIKLDAMENPYIWPASMRAEWVKIISQIDVNRYPDPEAAALKIKLRQEFAIPNNLELLLGNGSDELIQILLLAVGGNDHIVLSIEPSFVMYRLIANWTRIKYVGVPLKQPDFTLDINAILTAIKQLKPALIFLAYPNNPTGNLFPSELIHQIIREAPGLVVIDEAYAAFANASFIDEIATYNNLLVLRTLSKMGLAGLRLGYLIGTKDWIEQLAKIRMPYNINILTQVSAEFALHCKDILDAQTKLIVAERGRLLQYLSRLPQLTVYTSAANFILFRVPRSELVMENLKAAGILIKNLHGSHPVLDNCLRVTVGTPEENYKFLTEMQKICTNRS
ncbi:histidinol-phosphate aminotransferase [Achromatium sp. WMS2]|nr:histidinol-phosphate aminotransferase [Achromatium sp. WMS2]